MNRVPEYYPHVSRRLSQVLDDIGVNERTINMRRRTWLLRESMQTLSDEVLGRDIKCYHFGSQTEGTTTLRLNSDTDILHCFNDFKVIQDCSEWKCGKMNLLMIQDDTTPPGHCRLQLLQSNSPVATEVILNKHFEYDDARRVLMKNTYLHQFENEGIVRHGPAGTNENVNCDTVCAFSCRNWPSEAESWVFRYNAKQPMDINLIRNSVQSGYFVVATGHSSSHNERLEWRISTSIAERYLMFNMNITQIRCYVLLKMIIKTFITPNFPDTISSYHCKTVLMYLVENSQKELWHEEKLLFCVNLCLRLLHSCICVNNCPHYFIPGNNLIGGRLDVRTRQQLAVAFEQIIGNYRSVILGIEIDDVGDRLKNKFCTMLAMRNYMTSEQTQYEINCELYCILMVSTVCNVSNITTTNEIAIQNVISEMLTRSSTVQSAYRSDDDVERKAIVWMMPSLCTTMGSLLASYNISQDQNISNKALSFLSMGIDSDVASGRLKLASALFCAGDLDRCAFVLQEVEERYNPRVTETVCYCKSTDCSGSECRLPIDVILIDNINCLRSYFAFGVSFTRGEIHCVPQALQYEMFRCTEEENATRDEEDDDWMDWAVVDSLPYLYYLQYLMYGRLGRQRQQQRAIDKLIDMNIAEPDLHHRETALNLLGQCMEQESRLIDAFVCYKWSLNERPTHNVARWHIAVLLWKIHNSGSQNTCTFIIAYTEVNENVNISELTCQHKA